MGCITSLFLIPLRLQPSPSAGTILAETSLDIAKLAIMLQCLVLYTLLRAALMLTQALYRILMPELFPSSGYSYYFFNLCWQTAPWIATVAAVLAQRVRLTGQVA